MASDDILFLARYPFLRGSRDYVASMGLSFSELLVHPVYSTSLRYGRERVIECMASKFKPVYDSELSAKLTVLSYPLARMLAQAAGPLAAQRHADGEADATYAMLEAESPSGVKAVTDDLGLAVDEDRMPVLRYVRLAAQAARKNPRWKLVNRTVDKGLVGVDGEERKLLVREAVRERVLEPIDLRKIPEEVKREAAAIKASLIGLRPQARVESLEDDAVPPCMKGIVAAMEAGAASHNAMFILATFLANLGLPQEEMLKVFSRSPKYDEEKTTYQLGFITGERGGTEYTCPTCETIKGHGLCKADCPVKHPLQYYRMKARTKPKVKEESARNKRFPK